MPGLLPNEIMSMIPLCPFSEDRKSAYISAYRKEGLGDLDIYKITFNDYYPEEPEEIVKRERYDSIVYIYVENVVIKDVSTEFKENSDDSSGLLYRIQIGVYANSISSINVFKGVSDISKKRSKNCVKYFSGACSTLSNAKDAKENINELGITDAFIVAYYDGKSISIQEAISVENK